MPWMRFAAVLALLIGLVAAPHGEAVAASAATAADLVDITTQKWTGDLDGMKKRGLIRVLVPFNRMMYWVDGAEQRGTAVETARAFETYLNKGVSSAAKKVRVVFVPVPRDELISGIVAGKGDIAIGNLTITDERRRHVDFSLPFLTGVREIVVTGPGAPALESVDDLAGREVYVRASSSYYHSLRRLNARLAEERKPAVVLKLVDESLEDGDLLEMINAGLIPAVIVDDHKARFWHQVFTKIALHPDVAVNENGSIGWAFRKGSPKLEHAVDIFATTHKKGTLFGNMLYNRYLKDAAYVKNALSDSEIKKFNQTVALFKKYGEQYDFDYLMLTAQAYQESGLNNNRKSPVGAVGIMQIRPSTAADPNVNVKNINKIENNIHAGSKYLRFIADRYFSDAGINSVDRTLFSFAAYNAGPARVAALRKEAAQRGLNPDRWFQNVEIVAAQRIGRETVDYVANIKKYYVAYKLLEDRRADRERAKVSMN
jgi:membrane-bound lytic murein transglycosylase MltF